MTATRFCFPRRLSFALGLVLLLSTVGLARADSAPQVPPLSEKVVVTATLTPEEESGIGSATTVLTRDQIEAIGAVTVLDALREVPGVDVVQSGGEGAVASVFLRGSNSNQTLVLVDGVRVNSPYFGGYDFSALTTEDVDRIEVVRGPFSALYGSDALGGVIQIFTRPPASGAEGEGTVEVGNAARRGGSLRGSTSSGPLSVSGSYRYDGVEGDRVNSDWRERNGSLRVRLQPLGSFEAEVAAAILDGEGGVPGAVGSETPRARGRTREERISLPLSFQPAPGHEATVLVAQVVSKPSYRNPDDPFFGVSDTDARTLQVRATESWRTPRQTLVAFATWERWEVTSGGSAGSALDRARSRIGGVGVQESTRIGRGWSASGGIRIDLHSEFGRAVSPRASLSWLSPTSRWKVRASAGSAFRAPSLGELYYPQSGNPELRPERSASYEVGVERYAGGGRAEASLFWNEFRDLIVFDFESLKDQNVGRARTRGVELAWQRPLPGSLSLDAGYAWLQATDLGTGTDLPRRPRHRAFVALTSHPAPDLLLTARVTFVGRRTDVGPTTAEDPSWTRLDLFARWTRRRYAPYLRVENLAGRAYDEAFGYPAPGRRVAVGAEVKL